MNTVPAGFETAIASIRCALGAVNIYPVPVGLAIGTTLPKVDGDQIGIYLTDPPSGGFRVEDSGDTVPLAVACGVDLVDDDGAPTPALERILTTHAVHFDPAGFELFVANLTADDVGPASVRLVAALGAIDAVMAATVN
jgi:hypothetical protein